jgi:hypothetical protein
MTLTITEMLIEDRQLLFGPSLPDVFDLEDEFAAVNRSLSAWGEGIAPENDLETTPEDSCHGRER